MQQINKLEVSYHNLTVEVEFWISDAIEKKKNQLMHAGRSRLFCFLYNVRHNSAKFCISIWYDITLFVVSVIVLDQDLVCFVVLKSLYFIVCLYHSLN